MDGFGDNFDQPEIDPAAEFLAREQDQLAGLEDELNPIASAPPPADDGSFVPQASSGSFEMINNIGQDGFDMNGLGSDRAGSPSDGGFGDAPDYGSLQDSTSEDQPKMSAAKAVPREEPEKIKKWREEQKTRLQEKDAAEEVRKEELRVGAKKELDDWYTHHSDLVAKTKTSNREAAKNAEKQFVAEAEEIVPGTEWERIAKLCDFNPKSSKTSKDVSRMRSIILQLKQAPPDAKRA